MISIIVPIYNEQENVIDLYRRSKKSLARFPKDLKKEIIFIDDGSTDKTWEKLRGLRNIRLIRHEKNLGQTAALLSGFQAAKGEIIVTMDGDLQNDPAQIPDLVIKLEQGYDMVVGWRKKRNDSLNRKLLSKLAYTWRRIIFSSPIHDSGCSFKAFRKSFLANPLPPGQIHRFLPEIFLSYGFKVAEIPIKHYPRKRGKSKYNSKRVLRGFMDSWLIRFWLFRNRKVIKRLRN
ncbi:MAG TPA: glycosyltransferase family 2 protein [Candidatus Bathyarchaeia archaeon]|nr:glycosyltransferase family 2 protein [Candidatus Bathyarchaeia archaeon]